MIRPRPIQADGHVDFLGESEGSLPQPHDSFPDAGEAINDFWSMSGSFIYRHHVEPRVKLYSPREELLIRIWMPSRRSALVIIVTLMALETCLILGQVSHNLLYLMKKILTEKCGPGKRLTRKQLTSRPDHLWPELWKSMGKHAKLKEKQKWSEEKIHLENARKLRGIYFIDPEDTEFKETIKNARKKLETSVAPAMPCKIAKNCGSGASNKI